MDFNYKLIDFGNEYKIEQYNNIIVKRTIPIDINNSNLNEKININAIFNKNWNFLDTNIDELFKWNIELLDLKIELGFSLNGQIGIFPEQYNNWEWLYNYFKKNCFSSKLNILNGFSYTGISSLVCAKSLNNKESLITNIDASSSANNWAKQNSKLNNIQNIRFINDDIITFITREIKRGNKYNGIILDPPAFGKFKNKQWKFTKDIYELLKILPILYSDTKSFLLFSYHDTNIQPRDLIKELPNNFIKSFKNTEILQNTIKSQTNKELWLGYTIKLFN